MCGENAHRAAARRPPERPPPKKREDTTLIKVGMARRYLRPRDKLIAGTSPCPAAQGQLSLYRRARQHDSAASASRSRRTFYFFRGRNHPPITEGGRQPNRTLFNPCHPDRTPNKHDLTPKSHTRGQGSLVAFGLGILLAAVSPLNLSSCVAAATRPKGARTPHSTSPS